MPINRGGPVPDDAASKAAAAVAVILAVFAVLTVGLGLPMTVFVVLALVGVPLLMYLSRNMEDDDSGASE
jgi:Flp pilus assembly protein TadB